MSTPATSWIEFRRLLAGISGPERQPGAADLALVVRVSEGCPRRHGDQALVDPDEDAVDARLWLRDDGAPTGDVEAHGQTRNKIRQHLRSHPLDGNLCVLGQHRHDELWMSVVVETRRD